MVLRKLYFTSIVLLSISTLLLGVSKSFASLCLRTSSYLIENIEDKKIYKKQIDPSQYDLAEKVKIEYIRSGSLCLLKDGGNYLIHNMIKLKYPYNITPPPKCSYAIARIIDQPKIIILTMLESDKPYIGMNCGPYIPQVGQEGFMIGYKAPKHVSGQSRGRKDLYKEFDIYRLQPIFDKSGIQLLNQ